jgi:hypothetical protein
MTHNHAESLATLAIIDRVLDRSSLIQPTITELSDAGRDGNSWCCVRPLVKSCAAGGTFPP